MQQACLGDLGTEGTWVSIWEQTRSIVEWGPVPESYGAGDKGGQLCAPLNVFFKGLPHMLYWGVFKLSLK